MSRFYSLKLRHAFYEAMNKILITLVCIITCGCYNSANINNNNLKPTALNFNSAKGEELKLSSFIDSISYIKLETTNNIIGRVDKIKLYKNLVFILDIEMASSLFIFDNYGNYINSINSIGNGPGEIAQFYDFRISNNDELVVADAENEKLLYFSLEGEFKYEEKLNYYYDEIALHNNNKIIYAGNQINGNINDSFIILDSANNLKTSYSYIRNNQRNLHYQLISHITETTDGLLLNKSFNDTIYKYDESLYPRYYINFGVNSLTEEIIDKSTVDELFHKIELNDKAFIYGNIYESERFLIFNYKKGKEIGLFLYDRKTNEIFTSVTPKNDIDQIFLFPIQYVSNNRTVSVMDMENLHLLREYKKSSKNSQKLFELTRNTSPYDNPILMIGHLKD